MSWLDNFNFYNNGIGRVPIINIDDTPRHIHGVDKSDLDIELLASREDEYIYIKLANKKLFEIMINYFQQKEMKK